MLSDKRFGFFLAPSMGGKNGIGFYSPNQILIYSAYSSTIGFIIDSTYLTSSGDNSYFLYKSLSVQGWVKSCIGTK